MSGTGTAGVPPADGGVAGAAVAPPAGGGVAGNAGAPSAGGGVAVGMGKGSAQRGGSVKGTLSAVVQGGGAVAPGSPVRDVLPVVGAIDSPELKLRADTNRAAALEIQSKRLCSEADVAQREGERRLAAAQPHVL